MRIVRFLSLALLVGTSVGCGDAETSDTRGYTKAPLERPGLLIRSEAPSVMDSLGSPVLPRDTLIPPPPATPAGAPANR